MWYRQYLADPVLLESGFKCAYCGRDLLGDMDVFVTLARDHVIPQSHGGGNDRANRVASCAACDRLKGGSPVPDLAAARGLVAARRQACQEWYDRLRGLFRPEVPR